MLHTNSALRPLLWWKRETFSSQAIGWFSLTVLILSTSTYNPFAKQLTEFLSPLSLLFLSELLTLLFVLLSFGLVPTMRQLMRLGDTQKSALLAVGLLSGTIAPFLWFSGLTLTSAVNGTLFGHAETVFMILLAIVILKESWTHAHLVSAVTIAAGIVIIAFEGFSWGLKLHIGDLLIISSCLVFAIGAIIFQHYLHDLAPQIVIAARTMTALATFLLLSPFLDHTLTQELSTFPMGAVLALLGFAFVARFLNLFSFYACLERLPVSTVSLFLSLNLISGALFAHLYLGEPLLWFHYLGGAFILAGTMILEVLTVHPAGKHLEAHLRQKHHHRV